MRPLATSSVTRLIAPWDAHPYRAGHWHAQLLVAELCVTGINVPKRSTSFVDCDLTHWLQGDVIPNSILQAIICLLRRSSKLDARA